MIPFESMIERWADTANKKGQPNSVEAGSWPGGVPRVFCDRIELYVKTTGHYDLGTLPEFKLASFDPMTGRIIDKLANELVKREINRQVKLCVT